MQKAIFSQLGFRLTTFCDKKRSHVALCGFLQALELICSVLATVSENRMFAFAKIKIGC
jgi:hypothetical protein